MTAWPLASHAPRPPARRDATIDALAAQVEVLAQVELHLGVDGQRCALAAVRPGRGLRLFVGDSELGGPQPGLPGAGNVRPNDM